MCLQSILNVIGLGGSPVAKKQKKGAAAAAAAAKNAEVAQRAAYVAAAAPSTFYTCAIQSTASDAQRAGDNAQKAGDAEKDADARRVGDVAAATKNDSAVPVSQQMTMFIIHPYEAQEDNHINLVAGEYIYGVEMGDDGWCSGTTMDGETGWFPADCVTGRSDS